MKKHCYKELLHIEVQVNNGMPYQILNMKIAWIQYVLYSSNAIVISFLVTVQNGRLSISKLLATD